METDNNAWFQARSEFQFNRDSLKGMLDENVGATDEIKRFKGKTPGFVAPEKGDFRIKPDSPLLDAGLTIKEVNVDRDGLKRPCGKAHDIGAYELCK